MLLQASESGGTCSLEGSLPESPNPAEVCCCTVTPLGSGVLKNREKHTPSLPPGARSLTGGVTCMWTAAVQCRVPSWRGVPSTVDLEEVRAALQRALRTGPRSGEVKAATSGHGTVRAKGQRQGRM